MCLRISLGDVDDGDKGCGMSMDADQARVKAYELALLTLSRVPVAFDVRQVMVEAEKIERWLMAPYAAQQNTAKANTPYGTGIASQQPWVPVGQPPTFQPDLTPAPKPIKKADW